MDIIGYIFLTIGAIITIGGVSKRELNKEPNVNEPTEQYTETRSKPLWKKILVILFLFFSLYVLDVSLPTLGDHPPNPYAFTITKPAIVIGSCSFLVVAVLYFLIVQTLKVKAQNFIREAKSFPTMAPVFCLSTPVFGKEAMTILNVPHYQQIHLIGLSISCGVLFIVGMVLYWLGDSALVERKKYDKKKKTLKKNLWSLVNFITSARFEFSTKFKRELRSHQGPPGRSDPDGAHGLKEGF